MEKMKWIKKGISALLALNMVLSYVPVPTHAAQADGLCEHHPVHTAECGYVASMTGSDCTHTHDDSCGYVEAVEGTSCACEPAEDGTLIHQENCGYVEAVEGSPCTHSHDELCGYAEAVEGQPCGYECGECAAEAEAYSDLGIGYICAAGNGDIGLGSWVNGEGWNIEAESNIMTEVNANVYEITYTDLPASNNYALKFAADGVWAKSWGGTYMGSGVESDAVLGGSNISFPVSHAGSDVTLKLDLTGYDPDTQTGATFTVTVILPEEAGYTYDEETNTCTVTTANGLYHVAELVNGGEYSINITLAADIVLNENLADKVTVAEDGTVSADDSVRKWTPMEVEYKGTFDGGNHTIKGLYCVYNDYSNTGLIGTLAEGATVKNVKIHDFCLERDGGAVVGNNRGEVTGCSISGTGILGWTTGYQYVGGVVGLNEGTVKDCTSSATLTFRGMGYFGGIVGYNMTSQATIIDCSNSGTITAAGNSYMKVGGILGGEMGTVKDCYNTGSIRATVEDGFVQVGGIAGFVLNTVSGCYNTGTVSGKAMAESSEASVGGIAGYAEGTVSGCYNTGNISGDATFEGTGANVGGIAGFVQNTVSGCHNTGTISVTANAYSSACVGGITAVLNGTGSNCYNSGSLAGDGGEDCYVGGIAGECYDGGASNCYNIGSVDSGGYSGGIIAAAYGTFADCYYLDTCVKSGSTEQSSADGITAMSADQFASGEVAYLLNGDQSTITFKQTLGTDAYPSFTGGTVYQVTNCRNETVYSNTNETIGHSYENGTCTVCGEPCPGHTYDNACDAECNVCSEIREVGDHVYDGAEDAECNECGYVRDLTPAQITGVSITVDGVLYTEGNVTITPDTQSIIVTATGTNFANASNNNFVQYSDGAGDTLSSGYWTIDTATNTATLDRSANISWFDSCDNFEIQYCNDWQSLESWQNTGIFLTYYDDITVTIDTGASVTLRDADRDDYYEISTADELYAFAAAVNGGDNAINGELTANIVVNEGTMTAETTGARAWTPIGNDTYAYLGTFDGGGHTISGLYFNDSTAYYVGLFGCLESGSTVKNIRITDSYICAGDVVGGVAGRVFSGTVENCSNAGAVSGTNFVGGVVGNSDGTVTGCSNAGTVSGTNHVGGVAGNSHGTMTGCSNAGTVSGTGNYVGGVAGNSHGTMTGCYNTGTVTGTGNVVGGVVGDNMGTVGSCYNTGTVSGTGSYVGGVAGNNDSNTGTVTNCYYLDISASGGINGGDVTGQAEAKTADQFKSGEVAYLLGSPFGQDIGTDASPNFTGGTVYQVKNCKEENDYSNTNENIGHQWVNGTCTVCDLVCGHSGGTTKPTDNGNGTHSSTCAVCGNITEEHAFDENGTCVCGVNLFSVSDSTLTIDGTLGGKTEATEEDITVLVNKIKECVDYGITTIVIPGTEYAMYKSTLSTIPAFAEALYLLTDNSQEESQYRGTIDLILPDATEIIDYSFDSVNALKSITLPKVTTVGDGAFYGCQYLKKITFGSVITEVVEIESGVFASLGIKSDNEACDLVLNCGQLNAEDKYKPNLESNVWYIGEWSGETEWKSITLAHSYGDWVSNGDGTHTRTCANDSTHTENGDCSGGTATCTAPAVCITCGTGYGEKKPHSFNDSGFCTVCNTAAQAKLVANSDGTVTYFATLPEALAAEHNPWDEVYALADYEEDITIPAGLCFYGENHTFSGDVSVWGGRIFSGTFNGEVQVYLLDTVEEGVAQGFVYGGTFRKAVFVGSQCVVYGGTFEAELELVGSDVFNFAGDKYHFALGENFTLILGGDTTIDCQEHFEPLSFDCTVGKLCRLCREALTAPQAAHTGSNSTCSTEGACQVCGTLYLDPDVHAGERTNGIWTCCGKYQIPEQDADGVYEIDNAGKLFWFAAQVNSGNTALNARLTADIDLENRAWTPIGNDDNLYNGSFDGSGKTIKGLYIHDEAAQYVGLFGAIYLNAHVKAVTLTDSSVTGKDYVGGIVGRNSGTVTGCVNNAVVSGSGTSIGGIAGENGGTVELCGNTNTVTSNSSGCGGIVGRNGGTIRNCYNTGEVRATKTTGVAGGITYLNMGTVEYSWSTGKVTGGSNGEEGGIVGRNTDAVRYCCATQKAIGSSQYGATTNNVGTYTAAQFASGEVAYMLSSASEGEPVWGQTIGTDPYPVLGGAQVYHGYTSCGDTAAIYTNDETVSPEKPAHTGEADYTPIADGKQHIARWSCCGTVVTEAHTGGTATCQTQAVCQHCGESYGELDPNNHEYETNNGICCDTYQNAELNESGYYEIDNAGKLFWFAQQVNGGGYGLNAKLVNNITLNENLLNDSYALNSGDFRTWTPMGDFFNGYSGTFDGQGYVISGLYIPSTNTIQGMFSVVTGTVKNVILADTYVQGAGQDGGLVGYLRGGTVSNCGFDGVVKSVASGGSAGSYTAGVVAYTYGGTIENCFATGKFHSEGDHANPVFAYADTNGGAPTLTNNYYLENCSTDSTGTVNAVHCNDGVYATTEAQIASVTEEQILSGEVAYLLGGAWGQTIGTDSYPVLGAAKVYEIKVCEKTAYSNTEGDVPHNYVNGFCTAIPGEIHYQPAPDSDSDGFFEIGNAGQMFWFANHINTVDRTASAVLTADIDLEGRPWTPIGSTGESSNNFRGTFDGQNHTIKGLYVEGGRAGLGFFGEVRTGTVKNFTIYGEVVANTEVNYVGGVFGSICGLNSSDHGLERNGATIQNITSYVNLTAKVHGIGMIGGFVGYANHQSLIENCAWYGTFDAGIYRVDTGAGGFIGKIQENTSEVTIRNCGAYGTIKTNYAKNSYNNTPTIYMGGFLSFSNTNAKTTLENCLFAGKFERGANLTDQAFLGAFGTLRSVNAIKNCYYLGDDGLEAVHSDSNLKPGSDNVKITGVTGEQLLSGEIAYKLGSAWGQTIGTDDYPILGGRKVYYGYADCKATEKTYANSPLAETELVHSFNANGFCSVCDEYEPASDAEGDGYYDIDNAGKLYWFAQQVNDGNTTINGILTDDITVNEGVPAEMAKDTPDTSSFRAWTPIGHLKSNGDYVEYTGTFDGGEHTVSGLYFNDSTTYYVGLFGYVGSGGTVQNVGVIDSYFYGGYYVGGVASYNYGTVENCYNTGTVSGHVDYVGGVVGYNKSDSTVTNCYNTGDVTGSSYVGGVVGINGNNSTVTSCYNTGDVNGSSYYVGGVVGRNQGTLTNCSNTGDVNSSYYVGGVVGYNSGTATNCYNSGTVSGNGYVGGVVGNNQGTLTNCYNTGDVTGSSSVGGVVGYNVSKGTVGNCWYLDTAADGGVNGADVTGLVEARTAAQFASGEVAWLLNGDQSTIVFKQTIGTDAAPGFTGETVYAITNCVGTGTGAYSNTKTQLPHDYSNNNGFCTVCDAYEPATDSDSNNYYEIDNAGKLYWFAVQVNSGKTNINGELKANIVVNEDVHAEMIRINPDPSRFRLWTPIGTEDNGYIGDFCGNEHTVSGLYFNDSIAHFVGLFGYVGSGTVNHVGVIDSYFNGSVAVGGVVGCNEGTVEYAYNTGTVKGDTHVGGVVGDNYSTVKYAYNTGTVSGDYVVGGVVGSNYHTVKYAYNTGSVSGETDVGGVAGVNYDTFATVTNCYFDSTVYTGNAIGTDSGTATDVEGKTGEQFASGEVAYLLGYPFGQTIGTHFSPVLYKGDKVYYGYTSCGDVRMVYTNDSKASTEKPEHTGEATYTLTEDGAQHIAAYDCCGTTVTEDHTYENGFCPCGLYDLWVAGEQISKSHLTVTGTTGTATYDPKTDTLTLNGFDNGEKWCSFTNDGFYFNNAAVYTISDLNVVLEGENSLYVSGGNYNAAIQCDEAVTIDGDGTLLSCPLYSAKGTIINGGTLNILGVEVAFDGPSTTINGGSVNVSVNQSVTFDTLTVNGGRVVLENSYLGIANNGTILIGEGMAVYDANGALIENPDFKTLQYALIRVPCDHTQATASYTWTEDPITLKVTVSCTACGETFTGSTEDIDVTISDDGFTTTYTASVTLDGKTYTDSKKVTNQVTSVNIAWGSMEFTYTEDETGEGAWGSPDGANRIAVTNTGNTAVTVTAAYTQAEGYEEIEGKFEASGAATHTEPAAAGETAEFYLYLEGEPKKALKNTTVGTVTISIR